MTRCPCGCPGIVKTGNTYARSSCASQHLRQVDPVRWLAARRRGGREGGKTRAITQRARLIERLRNLDRDDAIWAAWQAGLHARRVAWQARKAAKAA
jgi:hypothetical protein